jgi:rRNA-processing protein FCF1
MEDALIARTAKHKTDVLVTNEKSLRKRIAKAKMPLKVWTGDEFIAWVKAQLFLP